MRAPPTDQFQLGTSTNDEDLGPGFMNWDISFFKSVPMGGSRRLQFRVELYNAFDTDQWNSLDTARSSTIQRTWPAARQTDSNFGRLTGTTLQRAPHPARRAVHVLID